MWLNKINRAPCWLWLLDREVVIHCQFILCSNLDLQEHGSNNELPRMNVHYQKSELVLNPICLSDNNHDILMDAASLREGLDYQEEIPDTASESSASNNMEDKDNTESESNDLEEEV